MWCCKGRAIDTFLVVHVLRVVWLQLRSLREFPEKTPAGVNSEAAWCRKAVRMWIWEIQHAFPWIYLLKSPTWIFTIYVPNRDFWNEDSFDLVLWLGGSCKVMAFELTYRLTFIDTVETATTGLMGPRSRSLPALGRSMPGDEEIQYREPWKVWRWRRFHRNDGWRMMRMMRMMMFHSILLFLSPPRREKKHHAGRRISTSSGNITKKMPLCHSWPFLWYASFTHTAGKCHSCIQLQWQ